MTTNLKPTSETHRKLLSLLGVDALYIEASPTNTCWYMGRSWEAQLTETHRQGEDRVTLQLTTQQATLAELSGLLDLNERFAQVYSWLTLKNVKIYASAAQHNDREYLSIEATVVADSQLNLLGNDLSTGALENLRLRARLHHRRGTYKKEYTVALLADFRLTNTDTLQAGIELPVGQTGSWTLELHQTGEGLSWDTLKGLFVPTQQSTEVQPLADNIGDFLFRLNTLQIRFDPTATKPIHRIALDVEADGSWNLLGDTTPKLALSQIGLSLHVDHPGGDTYAYGGTVRGTVQIGSMALSAQLPLPWTGSFTLSARSSTEATYPLDTLQELADNQSLAKDLPGSLPEISLRELEVVVEAFTIQSSSLHVSSPEPAQPWEIWKDHLTLDAFDLSLHLHKNGSTWQSSGAIKAKATLQGIAVSAKLQKDADQVWQLSITDPVHFKDLDMVKALTGLDLGEESTAHLIPPLEATAEGPENFGVVLRQFRMRTLPGKFELDEFTLHLATEGRLKLSNELWLDEAAVVLHTQGGTVQNAQIGGTLRVAGHPIRLVSEKSTSGDGWTFSGQSQPGDAIPILALGESAQLGTLPLPEISVQDLSLHYTPSASALTFSALASLHYSDKLEGRFRVKLDHRGGAKGYTTFSAAAYLRMAEAIFRIDGSYQQGWTFSGYMEGTLSLRDLVETFTDPKALDVPPTLGTSLSVSDVHFHTDLAQKSLTFSGAAELAIALPKGNPLTVQANLELNREGVGKPWDWLVAGEVDLPLGDTTLRLTAQTGSGKEGWHLATTAAVPLNPPPNLAQLLEAIQEYLGGTGEIPAMLKTVELTALEATLDTGSHEYSFTGAVRFPFLNSEVALQVTIEHQHPKGDTTEGDFAFRGTLQLGTHHTFALDFSEHGQAKYLVGTYQSSEGDTVSLGELVGSLFDITLTPTLTFTLNDALLGYEVGPQEKKAFLMAHLGMALDLANLPLLGRLFPKASDTTINYQLSVATAGFSKEELSVVLGIRPGITLEAETLDAGLGVVVQMPFANTQVELPLAINTEENTLPDAEPEPLKVDSSPSAPPDPAVKWYSLQKRIGPLHFSRIGVKYQDGELTFLLDAGLQATGLDVELQGLSVSTPLTRLDPTFHLAGLALDFQRSGVEIGGALQRVPPAQPNDTPEYDGTALIKVGRFSVGALGSYSVQDGHPSLFIYGTTHAPLGGPPFFFVTGLSAGFGYNRALRIPKAAEVLDFPLVQAALAGSPPDTPLMHALE
ncbi:MAG: DUF6603 domain-containing protein, partial [Bacteroidota bacterium]